MDPITETYLDQARYSRRCEKIQTKDRLAKKQSECLRNRKAEWMVERGHSPYGALSKGPASVEMDKDRRAQRGGEVSEQVGMGQG